MSLDNLKKTIEIVAKTENTEELGFYWEKRYKALFEKQLFILSDKTLEILSDNEIQDKPFTPFGDLSLLNHLDANNQLDEIKLQGSIEVAIRFLDACLEIPVFNDFAKSAINQYRKIGISISDFEDFLAIKSDKSFVEQIDYIGSLVSSGAYRTSEALAEEKGTCLNWSKINRHLRPKPFEFWLNSDTEELVNGLDLSEKVENDQDLATSWEILPRRNSHLLLFPKDLEWQIWADRDENSPKTEITNPENEEIYLQESPGLVEPNSRQEDTAGFPPSFFETEVPNSDVESQEPSVFELDEDLPDLQALENEQGLESQNEPAFVNLQEASQENLPDQQENEESVSPENELLEIQDNPIISVPDNELLNVEPHQLLEFPVSGLNLDFEKPNYEEQFDVLEPEEDFAENEALEEVESLEIQKDNQSIYSNDILEEVAEPLENSPSELNYNNFVESQEEKTFTPKFGIYQIVKITNPQSPYLNQFVGILDYKPADEHTQETIYKVTNNNHLDPDFWIAQNSLQMVDMFETLEALNQKPNLPETTSTKSIKVDGKWESVNSSNTVSLDKVENLEAPVPKPKPANGIRKMSQLNSFSKLKKMSK